MPFTVNRSNYLIPPETQFPDSSFRLSHNTGESLEFLVRLGGCPIRWGSNTHPQGKFLVPCQPHWPRDLPEVPQTLCSRLLSIPLIRTTPFLLFLSALTTWWKSATLIYNQPPFLKWQFSKHCWGKSYKHNLKCSLISPLKPFSFSSRLFPAPHRSIQMSTFPHHTDYHK